MFSARKRYHARDWQRASNLLIVRPVLLQLEIVCSNDVHNQLDLVFHLNCCVNGNPRDVFASCFARSINLHLNAKFMGFTAEQVAPHDKQSFGMIFPGMH